MRIWVSRIIHVPAFWAGLADVVLALALATLVLRWRRVETLWALTRFLNVFAVILIVLPIGSAVMAKQEEPDTPFKRRRRCAWGLGPASQDTRHLLHHPRRLRPGRRAKGALRQRHRAVPGAARGARVLRGQAEHGELLPDAALPVVVAQRLLSRRPRDEPRRDSTGAIGTLIGEERSSRPSARTATSSSPSRPASSQTEHPEADHYRSPYPYLAAFHRMLLGHTPL